MAKERLWALLGIGMGVLYLTGPSRVPLDLWIVAGHWATAIVATWLTALTLLVWRPGLIRAHYLAAFCAVIVFGGRGGGFLAIVLGEDRPDLWTAVAERGLLAAWATLWHLRAIRMIGLRRIVELQRTYLAAFQAASPAPDG